MAQDAPAPIDPDDVIKRSFTTVRRGLDPLEVQRYLLELAGQIRASRERERDLAGQLAEAEKRATPIDQLDPSRLTALLGEETARVLDAARAAAAEIRAKAEENVARLLREARDEAQRMRDEAESLMVVRTEEAEAEVARIMGQADGVREQAERDAEEIRRKATAIREQAERDADGIREAAEGIRAQAEVDAAARVEEGRQEGRVMVAEAKEVRQRMLDDLARRRKLLRQQIEQLQAGRDRLLAAYEVVRETLDTATEELHVALPEAKLAAETAAMRAAEDDHATFDAEVEAATEGSSAEGAATTTADDSEDEGDTELDDDGAPAGPASASVGAAEGDADDSEDVADQPEPGTAEGGGDGTGADQPATADEAEDAPAADADTAEGGADEAETVTGADGAVDDQEPAAEVAEGEAPVDAPGDEVPADDVAAAEGDGPDADADAGVVGAGSGARGVRRGGPKAESADRTAAIFRRLREDEVAPASAAAGAVAAVLVAGELDGAPGEEDGTGPSPAPVHPLVPGRDAAAEDLERALARQLKRALSDEQNEVLDAIRRQKGTPRFSAVVLAGDAHTERYRALVLPVLADAVEAGGELVADRPVPEEPADVGPMADEVVEGLVGPLRARLERAFTDAASDRDDLAEQVRAAYRESKAQRVEAPVHRAVLGGVNLGLVSRLEADEVVVWVVDDGGAASPDCEDNGLADPQPVGEAFPTGHRVPPLHDTCRCIVVPAPA